MTISEDTEELLSVAAVKMEREATVKIGRNVAYEMGRDRVDEIGTEAVDEIRRDAVVEIGRYAADEVISRRPWMVWLASFFAAMIINGVHCSGGIFQDDVVKSGGLESTHFVAAGCADRGSPAPPSLPQSGPR